MCSPCNTLRCPSIQPTISNANKVEVEVVVVVVDEEEEEKVAKAGGGGGRQGACADW